jgi:D-tyrosyl-tRNA(Tyr) deacylase
MRVVLQRVSRAELHCASGHRAVIGRGLLILAGVERRDGPLDAEQLAKRIPHLRLFPDASGVMNLSVLEMNNTEAGSHASGPAGAAGEILLVSQFTLHADTRRGRRPYYGHAAPPTQAEPLLEALASGLRAAGCHVATGVFGDHMEILLKADGPVTILLDTADGKSSF